MGSEHVFDGVFVQVMSYIILVTLVIVGMTPDT